VTGPTNPFIFRPCRGCASKMAASGEVVVADIDATIAIGRLVGPHRERPSGPRRRQAQALYDRLANVPRAPGLPPADEPCMLETSEFCQNCSAALAELRPWRGPSAVFANSACAPLARYVDPRRAPLSADDEAQAFRFQLALIRVVDAMFEGLRPDAFREQASEP